jgi:hypothetical protein
MMLFIAADERVPYPAHAKRCLKRVETSLGARTLGPREQRRWTVGAGNCSISKPIQAKRAIISGEMPERLNLLMPDLAVGAAK